MAKPAKGLSMVEILIAVALMAVLMASIAAAVQASLQSYKENEAVSAITQAARACLVRMMRDVRTADAVDSTSSSLSVIPADDGSGTTLVQYELSGGTLYYRRKVGASTTTEAMFGPGDQVTVTSFDVTRQTAVKDSLVYTRSVTARMTFDFKGRQFTVTASADPRRNQDY